MYIGIITPKSSALSISALLIFEIQETNGAYFLSDTSLSGFVTVIVPLTTIYASLKSLIIDLSVDVLNSICLYHYPTDHELLSIFQ